MRKIIDLDRVNTYSWSEITSASPYKEGMKEVGIPSAIVDKLIRLTAKWTNRFGSDLLISIDSMRENFLNRINDENSSDYLMVYFGFRKDGVDHKEFIEVRTPTEYNNYYSEVWRVEIYHNPFSEEIEWSMRQLSDYINNSDIMEVE